MRFLSLFVALVALCGVTFTEAAAQTAAPTQAAATRLPERIVRPMQPVDAVTLRAEGLTIRLWGIKPASSSETQLELGALDLMEKLIQEQQVSCKIEGGVMPELLGRCVVHSNQDLALELLSHGFAIVDRRQTYSTVFATAYAQAEESGRSQKKGIWGFLERGEGPTIPKWLQSDYILPVLILGGFLGGFAMVAAVLARFMSRVTESQSSENQQAERKEAMLQSRERQVLVTTLEGELVENKNKIEAFLVIYGDLLRSLTDGAQAPKYQQVGDIVQKHPSFSKTVFEANVNKLSLVDIKLAGHLSKLYSAMPKEQEYINLDPNVPLDTAVKLVEKVLKEAEDLLAPISHVIKELQDAARQS